MGLARKSHLSVGQVSRTSAPYFAGTTPKWTTYTYDHFGKTSTIQHLDRQYDGMDIAFVYGPTQERQQATLTTAWHTLHRYYAQNSEYTEIYADQLGVPQPEPTITLRKEYIYSPYGLIGIRNAYLTDVVYFNHEGVTPVATDHLGSIVAAYSPGRRTWEFSGYDAWGRRYRYDAVHDCREYPDEEKITGMDLHGVLDAFSRGYTGHEHLDMFGLINMNGRMYDPMLGRMLSPDTYVPDGTFTQDFNRYTYARNNPLSYTDPDGEFLFLAWLFFSDRGYELQKSILPIAIKFDLHLFGSDQKGIGFDISVGIPKAVPFSYRWHWGATYYSRFYNTGWSGWETRKGEEFGLFSGLYSASYTNFQMQGMEDFNQTLIRLTWKLPGLSVSYENDYIHHDQFSFFRHITPNSIMHRGDDKQDRWRTASVHLQVGPLSYGQKIITGDPGPYDNRETYWENGQEYYSGGGEYRAGIWYIGFGPLRLGGNSESFRHQWQNEFAHRPRGIPFFPWITRRPRLFWYIGTGTGGTNW